MENSHENYATYLVIWAVKASTLLAHAGQQNKTEALNGPSTCTVEDAKQPTSLLEECLIKELKGGGTLTSVEALVRTGAVPSSTLTQDPGDLGIGKPGVAVNCVYEILHPGKYFIQPY